MLKQLDLLYSVQPPTITTRMKSTVLILLCLTHLFSLLVKETDCIGSRVWRQSGKRGKVMTIFHCHNCYDNNFSNGKEAKPTFYLVPPFSVHCHVFFFGVCHQPKENVVVFKLQRKFS